MLHAPGLQPSLRAGEDRSVAPQRLDDFRDNWWTGNRLDWPEGPTRYDSEGKVLPTEKSEVAWLTDEERRLAETEYERLRASGSATAFVTLAVLEWARTHPNDPRSPEALARVVRLSRLSHEDEGKARWTRRAFQLLHANWPKSEWARRTPYWYN